MKKTLPLYLIGLVLLAGCGRQFAYFQSPLHNSTNSYKTLPLQKDSIKAATYASGVFSGGGANQNLRDGVAAFIGSVYRAHNLHKVQAYYGATTTLGNYHIHRYADEDAFAYSRNLSLNDSLINLHQGNNFFGSVGVIGGINFVAPFENGGEWRILGLEASWQQEFGKYLSFRKGLPDTAANIIDRHSGFMTFALGTEAVLKLKKGTIGFKIARGFSTHTIRGYNEKRGKMEKSQNFFTNTLQVTIRRITGFAQFNYGTSAFNMISGVNCRLGK